VSDDHAPSSDQRRRRRLTKLLTDTEFDERAFSHAGPASPARGMHRPTRTYACVVADPTDLQKT